MEVKTGTSGALVTDDERDDVYVSPEVAAAQAGETVNFDMDVTPVDQDENDSDNA